MLQTEEILEVSPPNARAVLQKQAAEGMPGGVEQLVGHLVAHQSIPLAKASVPKTRKGET